MSYRHSSGVPVGGALAAVRKKATPLGSAPARRPLISNTLTPLRLADPCKPSFASTLSTSLGSVKLLPDQKVPEGVEGLYTVVFDLDETLVFNRNPYGGAVLRPHLRELLNDLKGKVEIVLWTASVESVGRVVLHQMDPDGTIFQHAIYRHRSWFKEGVSFAKDLRLLGRDLTRTIIIENTPQCVRLQRDNGIIVPNFFGTKGEDNALLRVRDIILDIVNTKQTVPGYLTTSPALIKTAENGGPLLITAVSRINTWSAGKKLNESAMSNYFYRLKQQSILAK